MGQEKPDKIAHILTVNNAVLSSLSDTDSLPSSPVYSESSTRLSSESSTLCSLSSSMKSIYPLLQKTNIYLTNRSIFAPILMQKQRNRKRQSSLPLSDQSFFLKLAEVWLFSKITKVIFGTRVSSRGTECVRDWRGRLQNKKRKSVKKRKKKKKVEVGSGVGQ